MRDYDFPQRPPPQASLWRRLWYELELWSIVTSAPPVAWGKVLRVTVRVAGVILLLALIFLVVFGLPFALLIWGFGLVVDFFIGFFHLQSSTDPVYEIAVGLVFFIPGGLFILLKTRREQEKADANPPRRGLVLPFSEEGNIFWGGMAFCAIGAAQIIVPAYAYWLNILFWVVVGCVVFPSVPRIIFTLLRRRFRRPAHWQY